MSSSVEHELWQIFTYYTLRGDALDPEHLKTSQFLQLLRDCLIVKPRQGEEPSPEAMALYCGNTLISQAQATVYFTKETAREHSMGKKAGRKMGGKSLTFDSFLNALMRIAHVEIYPDKATVDLAFQELLMSNVLPYPFASRRTDERTGTISELLVDPEIMEIRQRYGRSLKNIFRYYGSEKRHQENRAFAFSKSEAYDALSPPRVPGAKTSARRRGAASARENSLTNAIGYRGWIKFCSDFALANSILSIFELGDIFLTSVRVRYVLRTLILVVRLRARMRFPSCARVRVRDAARCSQTLTLLYFPSLPPSLSLSRPLSLASDEVGRVVAAQAFLRRILGSARPLRDRRVQRRKEPVGDDAYSR